MTVKLVGLLALALVVIEREFFLGLWRRWLGSGGGHRWIKISVLAAHDLAWLAWALAPLGSWLARSPWGGIAVFGMAAVWCAGLAIWFVSGHDNGGPGGSLAGGRYGWCGLGYPWAYPVREYIPEIRLPFGLRIEPCGWTSVGEVFLGAATGRFTGLALAGVHIAGRCLAPGLA